MHLEIKYIFAFEKNFISILIEIIVLLFEESGVNLKAMYSLLDSL